MHSPEPIRRPRWPRIRQPRRLERIIGRYRTGLRIEFARDPFGNLRAIDFDSSAVAWPTDESS